MADADVIAALHVSTWQEAYSHLLPADHFSEGYVDSRHRMWDRVLASPREHVTVRVADIDGTMIGFAWAGPNLADDGEEAPLRR